MPTPVTPQVTQAQSVSDKMRGQVDPRIRATFAGARADLKDSFLNPMGAYTTPAIRDATMRNGNAQLAQQEAQALSEADFTANGSEFDRLLALSQLTAPKLVQTGGSSTATQSGGIAQGIIGGAASIGSAALM